MFQLLTELAEARAAEYERSGMARVHAAARDLHTLMRADFGEHFVQDLMSGHLRPRGVGKPNKRRRRQRAWLVWVRRLEHLSARWVADVRAVQEHLRSTRDDLPQCFGAHRRAVQQRATALWQRACCALVA